MRAKAPLSLAGLRVDPKALEGLPDAEREVVAGQLAAWDRLVRENPLWGYVPHAKQVVFHSPPFPRLRAFFGGNRCLAEGTLVRMADGSARRIEDVRAGEWVLGSNEQGSAHPVRVLSRWRNGEKPCYRFKFGKRRAQAEVVATLDHRVLARHEKGYTVVLPLGLMEGGTRSRWSIKRSVSTEYRGDEEPYALLYGMLLGDGSTINGRVQFTCADPDVLALLYREAARFDIRVRQNPANEIQYHLSTGPSGVQNKLSARLKERGMACYAHEKRLPDMTGWSNESAAELLAGLLITDGSVWKASEGWRLGFTSVSQALVEGVKRELEQRFGVYGSTVLVQEREEDGRARRTEFSLTIGNHSSLTRIAVHLPAYAKLKKLRTALRDWEGKRSDAARLRYRGREQVGMVMTYDLEVDHPDHLFVLANGLVVHNSGKTTAAIVDTLIQCVDRDVVPPRLLPYKRWDAPFKARVMTPDLTGTLDGVIHEKIRDWCPPGQLKGSSFDRAFDKTQRKLAFKNGSWIQFNSSEQEREKLGGVALHRVVYDEEPREEARKECRMRLADFNGEEIFALTPFSGMKWLYDQVYEPWEMGLLDPAKARVVVVDMDDNPHLDPEGKEAALEGLTGPERQARKSGRFVSFSGLIYPMFSPERHVVPQISRVPGGVEVFRGIDPGIRHMCAVGYYYLDEENELVKFDEITLRGATVKQVCDEMRRRDDRWGVRKGDGTVLPLNVHWTVIDPASRNRNNQTGRSDQQEFADNGVPTIPGQNDRRAGINRVAERLEAGKLKICANCTETLGEFRRYRWVQDTGRGEHDASETPVKKDDHCFPAGTLVDTEAGRRPIETIQPGERVWTRQGLFPALLAGMTQDRAETRVLRLEDGTELCGTGNHPIYVSGRGWIPLDSIRYDDKLLVWQSTERKLSGTGSSSTAIRTPRAPEGGCISSPPRSDFIARSGSSTTVRSLPATTSITPTATLATTTSPTLNASPPAHTSPPTGTMLAAPASEYGCEMWSGRPRARGMDRQMGFSGTASTPGACSEILTRCLTAASSAVRSLRARSAATSASAPTTANRRGAGRQDLMTWIGSANGAARTIAPTGTPSPRLVPLRVVEGSRGPSVAVYNLTVLGPPEYFANGILVHNCMDEMRYVVMTRPLAPEGARAERSLSYKERLVRHSLRRLSSRRQTADSGFGPGQWA